ncbi:MAG: hypothetical protein ACTTH8_00480 [Treponema sp.]
MIMKREKEENNNDAFKPTPPPPPHTHLLYTPKICNNSNTADSMQLQISAPAETHNSKMYMDIHYGVQLFVCFRQQLFHLAALLRIFLKLTISKCTWTYILERIRIVYFKTIWFRPSAMIRLLLTDSFVLIISANTFVQFRLPP